MNAAVFLMTLFHCIDGRVNMANALLPLALADESHSSYNSSLMVERIIADPKLFVSQMASADPQVIRNVIGMLQQFFQTGTTAVTKFETDVTNAEAVADAKIKIHDDLSTAVEELTKTLATKMVEKRSAGADKTNAVAHHTSMVAERDANVPDLSTENRGIRSAISLLEGLLPAPTAAPTTASPTTASPTTAAPTTAAPTTAPASSVIYYSNGADSSYDDMKAKCGALGKRLCYFDEVCPEGLHRAPVGGQQSNGDAWSPVQAPSSSNANPHWVQVGTGNGGMCTHSGGIGSWMITRARASWKGIYPCCASL